MGMNSIGYTNYPPSFGSQKKVVNTKHDNGTPKSMLNIKNAAITTVALGVGIAGHKSKLFGTKLEAGIASLITLISGLYFFNRN